MDRVKQLLVNDWYSAKATKLKSPSCRTVLVLILWGATKWDKPAKWEGSPLARLVPLRGPLLHRGKWGEMAVGQNAQIDFLCNLIVLTT